MKPPPAAPAAKDAEQRLIVTVHDSGHVVVERPDGKFEATFTHEKHHLWFRVLKCLSEGGELSQKYDSIVRSAWPSGAGFDTHRLQTQIYTLKQKLKEKARSESGAGFLDDIVRRIENNRAERTYFLNTSQHR